MNSERSFFSLHLPLASAPMVALLSAQFVSALADNVLFILVLALIRESGGNGMIPLVQEFFVFAFILLAPFVGPFADSQPKGRVMLLANGIKLLGAGYILAGGNALVGYAIVGAGAAAYSPAKYGILTQLFDPAKLVKANGWLEGSTIAAILLGVVLGGFLADQDMQLALWLAVGLYGLASLLNLFIPRLPPEKALQHGSAWHFLKAFWGDVLTLFKLPDARFSLLGTGLFWACGATLRLLLFAWVPVALLIDDTQTPANLMGVVSIGIVIGAALAGSLVKLSNVNRVLFGGVLLGPLILALAFQSGFTSSALLLGAIGLAGGYFAIPLNALLQETGHETIGAGRALAVQNFTENSFMLLMVGIYYTISQYDLDAQQLVAVFGGFMLLGMGWLALNRLRFSR
ncbi:MAG: lysophospholipid transporter LplT [Thiobacillus sp.]|nr:lysophospholipid transporter LplT [Thiobacillus sp.]